MKKIKIEKLSFVGKWTKILAVVVIILASSIVGGFFIHQLFAGNIDSPAPPSTTMPTLDEIYCKLTGCTPASRSLDPAAPPAPTMYTLQEIYDAIGETLHPQTHSQCIPFCVGYNDYVNGAASGMTCGTFCANKGLTCVGEIHRQGSPPCESGWGDTNSLRCQDGVSWCDDIGVTAGCLCR